MVLLYTLKGSYAPWHVFLGNWHSNVPCHILFLQSHTSFIIKFLYGSLILEPSANNFTFWWSVHQGHHLLPLLIDFIHWLSRMQLRHINVHINNRSKGYVQICNNILQFLCTGILALCAVPRRDKSHAETLSSSLRLAAAFTVIMQTQSQIRMLKSFFHHFYNCIQRLSLIIVVSQIAFWKLVLHSLRNKCEREAKQCCYNFGNIFCFCYWCGC